MTVPPLNDEIRYRLLTLLDSDPNISQRDLAKSLGISLGKTNYCLQALMARGWVKVNNFKRSRNKRAYAYFLTPKGMEEKVKVTGRFLKFKMDEYEALKREISILRRELDIQQGAPESPLAGQPWEGDS